jgi:hypothetical protein
MYGKQIDEGVVYVRTSGAHDAIVVGVYKALGGALGAGKAWRASGPDYWTNDEMGHDFAAVNRFVVRDDAYVD